MLVRADEAKADDASPPADFAQAMAAAGLRPIEQTGEKDIFVCGYPKSGNTWMQYLVAGAFCGVDLKVAPDALIQDVAPDVHFKSFYKPYFPVTFFKSHFLPRPGYRKVVYLVRDGRDVMVSYLHYVRGLTGTEIDFLDFIRTGKELFPCKWHEHVEQWMSNPCSAEMIIVRYEDLKSDAVTQLARIADFAGITTSRDVLERAARDSSFAAMKEREKKFAWENPQIPKNQQFVRRGTVGSHRDEMTPEALAAFLAQAGPALEKMGYPP